MPLCLCRSPTGILRKTLNQWRFKICISDRREEPNHTPSLHLPPSSSASVAAHLHTDPFLSSPPFTTTTLTQAPATTHATALDPPPSPSRQGSRARPYPAISPRFTSNAAMLPAGLPPVKGGFRPDGLLGYWPDRDRYWMTLLTALLELSLLAVVVRLLLSLSRPKGFE